MEMTILPAQPLSEREAKLLERLELDIEQNLKGFIKVGFALATIRAQELYRVKYDTFEDYCRFEWDMSRQHAYRLIDCSVVIENLSPMGDTKGMSTIVDKDQDEPFTLLPANERQARPLALLPPEQQVEAWSMVIEEAKRTESSITAAFIQNCINTLRQKKVSNTIRKAREDNDRLALLPDTLKQSYQSFMDELQATNEELFDPKGRQEIVRVLREILETIES